MAIQDDYETDKATREYVDKFAKDRGITPQEAMTHLIVLDVWEGRKKENAGKWQGIGSLEGGKQDE